MIFDVLLKFALQIKTAFYICECPLSDFRIFSMTLNGIRLRPSINIGMINHALAPLASFFKNLKTWVDFSKLLLKRTKSVHLSCFRKLFPFLCYYLRRRIRQIFDIIIAMGC